MSTLAITPWRDRKHLGHPEGKAGQIRDWRSFTVVIYDDGSGPFANVAIIGPSWPDRPQHPALTERYRVPMPAGGPNELKSKLRAIGDARQASWLESHRLGAD